MDSKIEFVRNPVSIPHRIDYQMIKIRQFIYEDGIDPITLKKFSDKLEVLTKKHLRGKKPKKSDSYSGSYPIFKQFSKGLDLLIRKRSHSKKNVSGNGLYDSKTLSAKKGKGVHLP